MMQSYGSVAGFIRRDMQQKAEPKKRVSKDGYKTCRKCGNIMPRTMFSISRKHGDGLNPYCRECVKEICRKRRLEKKAKDAV